MPTAAILPTGLDAATEWNPGGASNVALVSDDVDANAIWSVTQFDVDRYTTGALPGAAASINSVAFKIRCRNDSGFGSTCKVYGRCYIGAAYETLNTGVLTSSYVTAVNNALPRPGGGSWVVGDFPLVLEVYLAELADPLFDAAYTTKVWLEVDYNEAASGKAGAKWTTIKRLGRTRGRDF